MPTIARWLAVTAMPSFLSALTAQAPALNPTSNVTIPSGGVLHYSSILIPAGVTVQFAGNAPAIVQCDGDCIVLGTLSVAANFHVNGPGWSTLGIGTLGSYCPSACGPFGCACWGFRNPAGHGVHFGVYGAAVPFALDGGSPGGDENQYSGMFQSCCSSYVATWPGGGGGGTLVVTAAGRVEIHGFVDARGASSWISTGSSGSVLLRGMGGLAVLPTGQVLAGPGNAQGGHVRLDAWGAAPSVQGTIDAPSPAAIQLPYLDATAPPTIGTTWSLRVFAPTNTPVFLAASLLPGAGNLTPFGPLHVDLTTAVSIGAGATPGTGHDPFANLTTPIPANTSLLGLQIWLQALAAPASLAARLSNGMVAVVQ